jgi:hypothetical protein
MFATTIENKMRDNPYAVLDVSGTGNSYEHERQGNSPFLPSALDVERWKLSVGRFCNDFYFSLFDLTEVSILTTADSTLPES